MDAAVWEVNARITLSFRIIYAPCFIQLRNAFMHVSQAVVTRFDIHFGVESEEVNKVKPKRPPPPPPKPQPPPRAKRPMQPPSNEDVPTSSA
ncbi:hypothetical protein YC2023_087145 [Brassica napus]